MVRTGNVDFSCKRLTSIEIRKSKYHIIRRVCFKWDHPLRKISGSALADDNSKVSKMIIVLLLNPFPDNDTF